MDQIGVILEQSRSGEMMNTGWGIFPILFALPTLAAEPFILIPIALQARGALGDALPSQTPLASEATMDKGLVPCAAPVPALVSQLALQKLQLKSDQPSSSVVTEAYCTHEQFPAVVFVRVSEPALRGTAGYCGAALLRRHEGRWRTLWTGLVPEGEDQMQGPEPDGAGGLRFWFEHADPEQPTVREGWQLVANPAASPGCAVPAGHVSAQALEAGALQLCARWFGKGPARKAVFQPAMPYDTGIVSWPPYRLQHDSGEFAPPSPGEGAEFIQAFRPLELTAVCRQASGSHALLVQQQCEGTGCAPLMRRVEQSANGWRERWLGDRGWKPLENLLRCGPGEQALNPEAPFKPCACAVDDASSPANTVMDFEKTLRALGAARPLPVPDNDALDLWLHAEGPEIAKLAGSWDRLWQRASAAPLQRLDDLAAGDYRVQRLRIDQGWDSAEWVQVHHPRSGLRAWLKAPLMDSRRGETVFSSETDWRLSASGVLQVDLGRSAGGGAVAWNIGDDIARWGFRPVSQ
ncbi:MAG: hypothetical protein EPN60_17255 [Nevskiaceae bacterium]|nr:MAG: hypothetical protein EPO48_11090 [Nevskiaceae bacterium]TAM22260.1 MAG: hypothetical protein EPN60_17255 [Nevskiaceae bacterium]